MIHIWDPKWALYKQIGVSFEWKFISFFSNLSSSFLLRFLRGFLTGGKSDKILEQKRDFASTCLRFAQPEVKDPYRKAMIFWSPEQTERFCNLFQTSIELTWS